MKTYFKTFPRMFKRHITRLVSIMLMILVSIGFSAGIGMATNKMEYAVDDVYRDANLADLIVKSTRETGFTEAEQAALTEKYGEEHVLMGSSMEFEKGALSIDTSVQYPLLGDIDVHAEIGFPNTGDGVSRVYFYDMPPSDLVIGKLDVLETVERPQGLGDDVYDVYLERKTPQLNRRYALGDILTADIKYTAKTPFGDIENSDTKQFFVRGYVQNPMHLATRKDISLQFQTESGKQRELESVFYLFETDLSPRIGDAYITLDRDEMPLAMSEQYKHLVTKEQQAVEALLDDGEAYHVRVLTLFDNFSIASFHEFAGKIEGIGYVMMVVFLAVTLLVVLSTMTRLLEEERGQLACLSTLGYSPLRILPKYLLFALVGVLFGTLGAYFAGEGLAYIIYINFSWNFSVPPYPTRGTMTFFLIVSAIVIAATMAATFFAGLKKTRERPAEQLRPRAPRAGKKVLLELIPVLWNRISFKYKSSLRNVLRYKLRFFMTVIAVMFSTALVLAGLAVLDCCIFQDIGTAAMIGVGIVVVFFAAMLNFVVIYTLTNINISERSRELATLMVLGYHDKEVTGYVFREIYITCSIGIVAGLPFGCLLCYFIFQVMKFGSIPGIHWFIWVSTPILSLFFVFLVTVMLSPKIKRIKMNDSLKAVE